MDQNLLAGRYLHIKTLNIIFWYDTKDKIKWQVQREDIQDDVFNSGKLNIWWETNGDFLFFHKKGHNLPKEMNIAEDHTAFFVVKLKQ